MGWASVALHFIIQNYANDGNNLKLKNSFQLNCQNSASENLVLEQWFSNFAVKKNIKCQVGDDGELVSQHI